MGFDRAAFASLLEKFKLFWVGKRKRVFSAWSCSSLDKQYYGPEDNLPNLWCDSGSHILPPRDWYGHTLQSEHFQSMRNARLSWPTSLERTLYMHMVQQREPSFDDVFGFVDELNLKI